MEPKILVKFATRSRPEKFLKCLDNYRSLSTHDNYQVLVSADIDDPTMFNPQMGDTLLRYPNVKIIYGYSNSKVHAINRDVATVDYFDILVNTSDDMWFIKPGFDSIIVKDFNTYFPDFDGVMHYNDGNHYGPNLMTLSILGKKYYDRFGYIYHPEYISVYCDKEAKEVAVLLGKYRYQSEILFNHNHPVWAKAEWDAQYRKTEAKDNYKLDNATYQRRRRHKFYYHSNNAAV